MPDFMDALDYLSKSLDKPGRAVRGILGGNAREGLAAIPFSDTMGLTDPSDAVSGRKLLENAGFLDRKQEGDGFDAGDVAGIGTEMALDPINLFGGAALGKLGFGARAAKKSNAFRETLLASGGRAMPEDLAKMTKVLDEAGNPLRTYHGTPHVFDQFDKAKLDPGALFGPGVYTTDSPEIASEYALKGAQAPRTQVRFDPANEDKFHATIRELMNDPDLLHRMNERDLTVGGVQNTLQELVDGYTPGMNPVHDALVDRVSPLFFNTHVPGSPQNVRMQYIHAANPFVAGDVPHDTMDLVTKLRSAPLPPEVRTPAAGRTTTQFSRMTNDLLRKATLPGDDVLNILKDVNPENLPSILQSMGYDAIQHGGGTRMGGGKRLHQVTIALDPSQVYDPFILPNARKVPRLGPWAAGLFGANAARVGDAIPQE